MMARTARTSQMKTSTMPGMASPPRVLVLATSAQLPTGARINRQLRRTAFPLGVSSPDDPEREGNEGGGEHHEDTRLDALEDPEAAGRLVGHIAAVAGSSHACARRLQACLGDLPADVDKRLAARWERGDGRAVYGGAVEVLAQNAVRGDDAVVELPVRTWRREAAQQVEAPGDRADVVFACVIRDQEPDADEARNRDSEGRQGAAQRRTDQDAKCYRKCRVRRRHHAHVVEPGAEYVVVECVFWPRPPCHQGGHGACRGGRGQEQPA